MTAQDFSPQFSSSTFERLLKSEDVAQILNISKSMAYILMERGDIPTVHIYRAVRVRPQDLEQYIQSNVKPRK